MEKGKKGPAKAGRFGKRMDFSQPDVESPEGCCQKAGDNL